MAAATRSAFALWCVGGDRIVTWGAVDSGGKRTAVQDQLRNVRQVHATDRAFAAILADETVVTWDNLLYGGDSRAVQDHLIRCLKHVVNCTICSVCAVKRHERFQIAGLDIVLTIGYE